MREKARDFWGRVSPTAGAWVHWTVLAALTGVVCGAAGSAFSHAITLVTAWRGQHPWLLLCMPLAGLAIVWLYQVCGMENDSGTNQIIASVRSGQRPPLRLAPLIFIGSVLTHLTGGSAGREGAALQIGGSLACQVGQRVHLGERQMNVEVMCGMSGLFAALFGTPLTATVFAMEVVSVGIVHYSALFPCLLTALVSTGVTVLLGVEGEHYTLDAIPTLGAASLAQIGVLGVGCALLAITFCVVVHQTGHWYAHTFRNPYLRAVVGGVLVVTISLLEGSGDYNGAGGHIIALAVDEGTVHVPWAFALKLLLTALTLGAGYRGGEIVPTFFVGATFGCAVAPLLGVDPGFGAAVCMIALFCGVVNCPLASIFLSVELFGSEGLLFFALACALSYLLSGKFSLYSSQKIVYSKLEPRFIDENAH